MTPKIVDKSARREEIARVAMTLFVRRGFENTSVREITRAAGMGKGTFYDYFDSKEDILTEIARTLFEHWGELFTRELKKSTDPIEQLRRLVLLSLKEASEFEALTVMYVDLWRLGVGQEESPGFMELFRSFLADARRLAAGLIKRAQAGGQVRPDVDAAAMAAGLIAYIDGLAFHKMVFQGDMDLERLWGPFFESWLAGIRPGDPVL